MRTGDVFVVAPAVFLLATGPEWGQGLAVVMLAGEAALWVRRGLRTRERRS